LAQPLRQISDKPRALVFKQITENRSARHEYFITDEIECGIVLTGTEVKALRQGKIQLTGGFAHIDNDELWLENVHISAYEHGNIFNHETRRRRKLLAHQKEIKKLKVKTRDKGVTLVPVRAYFKGNKIKILIGLAKGKKAYDKRETIKERDMKREMSRE
jgi:SsrA-binding protein